MSLLPAIVLVVAAAVPAQVRDRPPVHLWLEPEWFDGVKGNFVYWTGTAKPGGAWGVAGPGVSAEWSQGGESEWNSMGAPAAETSARCERDLVIPRGGSYKLWVRYVDHRGKGEPFRVRIEQQGKAVVNAELGVQPIVPVNDEYQLFWGFSFGWGEVPATKLEAGPARLTLSIDRAGEAWRQVDAVLLTDDLAFGPSGRRKPAFAYEKSFGIEPREGAAWRGSAKDLSPGGGWQRRKLGGEDFTMWAGVGADPKWWAKQDLDKLSSHDVLFQWTPPADIRDKFHKQFAGRKDVPVMSWRGLRPGFYLGDSPDLSPGTPLRRWLERCKTPFFILTNYATGNYTDKTGPATYAALTGPLAEQFLGYIHGESVATMGVGMPAQPLAADRRGHVDALTKDWRSKQAEAWSKIYKTPVSPDSWSQGISCLSAESIALAHLFHEAGSRCVGYEIDATNAHVPMRIAFERGAARQYGHAWINYASGNFGDACNYFTQNPVVPRGAPAWFHSKYSITDGVSASWYRKLYYLNYLGGASAIFWEQGLSNQYILPGPGEHPIQLSPFGRATEDFQAFVERLPDRGEPYTPVAVLLSYGHGYERVNNHCKMLQFFPEDRHDRELRELFNVFWYPAGVVEGEPAAADAQSMPAGTYGDIFDVIVDRPTHARAMFNYPVIWAAGGVDLAGVLPAVEEYVRRGGTLVVNISAARKLPEKLLGFHATEKRLRAEAWTPTEGGTRPTTPYETIEVELAGAKALAWASPKTPLVTRHAVGEGAVIVTLMPDSMGLDERAHPALPYLANGLLRDVLPVQVRRADGQAPLGDIMYQLNKTRDGYLVTLANPRGIDKTQTAIARVDRRQHVDVLLRTRLSVRSAREMTTMRDLRAEDKGGMTEVRLRIPVSDLQVVQLVTASRQ